MMKRFLMTTAAVLLATSAYAADAFVYEETPAPILDAPGFSWTGFYVGVNAGYGGGKARADATLYDDVDDLLYGSLGITGSGFVAGAQAGYNWQSGSMVYGVETDIQWSGIEAEGSINLTDGVDSISGAIGSKIKWFGTTRLRIGYTPVERFMVYATGGVAYGNVESYVNANFNGTPFGLSTSETRVGWTAGLGAEYAFTNNMSLKTEYLYTDLGSWDLYNGPLFGDIGLASDADFRFHTVRAGLNFRF